MNYDESNDTVHSCDLEQMLLHKGLPSEHIAYLKNNNPKNLYEYHYYYDHLAENDKEGVLVDPKKIVDIFRGNYSFSYFDNAAGKCESELDGSRMATAIKYIRNDALAKIYDFYGNLYYPVDLEYFSNEDVYRVGCDGNHRSLYAKIIDAPLIKADITYYKRNEEKYKEFLQYEKICKDFMVLSTNQSFSNNETLVTFLYNSKAYIVTGYANPKQGVQLCEEQLDAFVTQLNMDFKILKKECLMQFLNKHPLVQNAYLRHFCIDNQQVWRLSSHIRNRKMIDEDTYNIDEDMTKCSGDFIY